MPEEKKEEEKKDEVKKNDKNGEEEEEALKIPANLKKIVEEIEKMSVIDLAELVKILEKKFGVSTVPVASQASAAAGSAAPAGGEGGEASQKSVYNIVLTGIGDKKIEVIKAVRDVTQKGLKDCKDLVEAAANEAQVIKENVKKEEAEEIKKKFEAAGATVELK